MINRDNTGPVESQEAFNTAYARFASIAAAVATDTVLAPPDRIDVTLHLPIPAPLVSAALLASPHPELDSSHSETFGHEGNLLMRPPRFNRILGPSLTVYDAPLHRTGNRGAWSRIEFRLQGERLREFIAAGDWQDVARLYRYLSSFMLKFSDCDIDFASYLPPSLEAFRQAPKSPLTFAPLPSLIHGIHRLRQLREIEARRPAWKARLRETCYGPPDAYKSESPPGTASKRHTPAGIIDEKATGEVAPKVCKPAPAGEGMTE